MNEIMNLITGLGFPVAMCLLMFYYIVKQDERHEKEIITLKDTINQNTVVLAELKTLIKSIHNEKEG